MIIKHGCKSQTTKNKIGDKEIYEKKYLLNIIKHQLSIKIKQTVNLVWTKKKP